MSRGHVAVALTALWMGLMTGCEQDKKPEAANVAATSASVVPAASSAAQLRPKHRPGEGFDRRAMGWWNDPTTMLLHAALQDESITDEQREKIDALKGPPDEAKGAMPSSMQEFRRTMAEEVKAGKIDEKALEPQLEAMRKAGEQMRAARANRLNDLHQILTPAQRKAAVEVIRARLESGMMDMRSHEGAPGPEGSAGLHHPRGPRPEGSGGMAPPPPPHGSGSAGAPPLPPMHHGGPEGATPGERPHGAFVWPMMLRDLDLTEAQQKKLDELAKTTEKKGPTKEKREELRAQFKTNMSALLDAFAQDTFDATTLALFKAPEKAEPDMMKSHLDQLARIVAILTPPQREKLADRMSKPDDHWRHMDPGGPHPGSGTTAAKTSADRAS